MGLIIAVVIAIVMGVISHRKGFNPLFWILAGGIIGFVVLLLMPSANAAGIDEAESKTRRQRGNITGGVISAVAIALTVVLILINIRLILNHARPAFFAFGHDLIGKSVSTFPDHALSGL
jgi:hypothetical protein